MPARPSTAITQACSPGGGKVTARIFRAPTTASVCRPGTVGVAPYRRRLPAREVIDWVLATIGASAPHPDDAERLEPRHH